MARLNDAWLNAKIETKPTIEKNEETGEYKYGMCIIDLVRGKRAVGDNKQYVKHDAPIVISKDEYMIREMENWDVNDIVEMKGVIVSKDITKISRCPYCFDDDGAPTKNRKAGTVVYINPIETLSIIKCGEKDVADKILLRKKELSNQMIVAGTVIKEPRIFRTKSGVIVCDYQIAIDRKYRIRTDDPSIKTDWIWIKSYGERAVEDKLRIRMGTELTIDGFIQTRNIKRKTVCPHCGQEYVWMDKSSELVPYAVEYHKGTFRTDEEISKEDMAEAETERQIIYDRLYKQKISAEEKESLTEEIEDVDSSSYAVDDKDSSDEEDENEGIPAHLPNGDTVDI